MGIFEVGMSVVVRGRQNEASGTPNFNVIGYNVFSFLDGMGEDNILVRIVTRYEWTS